MSKILEKSIQSQLENVRWEEVPEDPNQMMRSLFLGTVFSLMPSGKYYTPWACGNVEHCEACAGAGWVFNPMRDVPRRERIERALRKYFPYVFQRYGAWYSGQWPASVEARLHKMRAESKACADTLTCPRCHGMGSEEAWNDHVFTEQLEEEAAAIDACIISGEGDPCDLFIAQFKDKEDAQ